MLSSIALPTTTRYTQSNLSTTVILSFEAASTKVAALLQSFNHRFDRQSDSRTDNLETGLSLVKDEQTYTILHNSNHMVVEWLEVLGCQVRGFVLWANF